MKIDGSAVSVKGPKGELALVIASPIEAKIEDGQILVTMALGELFLFR